MKFIHTGDIHWGMTPDADKPWGSERAQAIKDTFKKIIAQAGKMQADCLFISGDLFHRQPLVRDLKEVNYLFTTIPNVKVILIAGNHDRIRENSALLSFSWSPNVTFFMDPVTIYIQPQFNHRTGEIAGGETLVRWKHPKKGLLKPQAFISMMEDKGLISKLDRYVWRMACEFLKKLENQGKKISLSVNISPKDFYYLDLYREFMGLVKEYDISPAGLKLEITESAVIMDVPKQAALIEKLQAEGFVVEMDDFGSGYSSLNTLKDIPVDILKLDMKFMEKSKNTKRSADIVQMVVAMADKLGMPVIAEGVETKEQADFLGRIGCDIIQGYYYAKPMSMEEFEQLLNKYPYRDIVQKGIGNDI